MNNVIKFILNCNNDNGNAYLHENIIFLAFVVFTFKRGYSIILGAFQIFSVLTKSIDL